MKEKSELERMSVRQFLYLILEDSANSDTAMYYLLTKRMNMPLSRIYQRFNLKLEDLFEDVLSNFYLYLRNGSLFREGETYPSLRRLRDKSKFRAWLCITFRNYLTGKVVMKHQLSVTSLDIEKVRMMAVDNYDLEKQIHEASYIIAYTYQQSRTAIRRLLTMYVLLRSIDRSRTQHYKELADILNTSHDTFRVKIHYAFAALFRNRDRLLRNHELRLDREHDQMRRRIDESFHKNLYETLFHYYKINYFILTGRFIFLTDHYN